MKFVFLLAVLIMMSMLHVAPVYAYQGIIELQTPDIVKLAERFTVTIRVEYDFLGKGDVEIWAGIGDSYNYMVAPNETKRSVNGKGVIKWNLNLRAPEQEGAWNLVAHVTHLDRNHQSIIDDKRTFTIHVFKLPTAIAEITGIHILSGDDVIVVGEEISLVVDINYSNLYQGTTLKAVLRDKHLLQDLGEVVSEPLETNGSYTFRALKWTPQKTGEWTLLIGVGLKACPPGLCGLQERKEFFTVKEYTIFIEANEETSEHESESTDFKFSIDVKPISQFMNYGGHAIFHIYVRHEKGISEEVILSISNLPVGSSSSFNPKIGKPDFNSELMISIPDYVNPGTYQVAVIGEGGASDRTAFIELKILPNPKESQPQITSTNNSSITVSSNQNELNNISMAQISILIITITVLSLILIRKRFWKSPKSSKGIEPVSNTRFLLESMSSKV